MSEAKFKIGDRVLTEDGYGVVVDVYCGKGNAYGVDMEEFSDTRLYFQEELELAPVEKEYSMDIKIDIAKNVVIASLYEHEGDTIRPLAKGNGHLIHEGVNGIAQAASYACKRLYENLGGQISKGGSWK